MVDEVPALRMGWEYCVRSNTMLSSGRCTTVTRPALAHWVHSATCFPRWCNGRSCAQRFIPHWSNGRSRAQWEKNLTRLAFMSTFFLFRISALPSTTGMTYFQTLTLCDPSTSPAHLVQEHKTSRNEKFHGNKTNGSTGHAFVLVGLPKHKHSQLPFYTDHSTARV